MISREKALRIARGWIDSWNRHDLDSIMSHYSEDVELISPIVIKLLGDESATVTGRDALREYFKKGWLRIPASGSRRSRSLPASTASCIITGDVTGPGERSLWN